MNPSQTSSVAAPTSAASVPSTVNPPELASAEQEVSNLRARLEQAERILAEQQAAREAKIKEDQRAFILSIPGKLGLSTLVEAVALINEHVRGSRAPQRATTAKRSFPRALPPETLEQMKAMLLAGATSKAVATALKVGLSTVDSRKAKWGLTNKNLSRKRSRPESKRGGVHISPAKRARIVEALKKPHVVVSALAKREGVSRQTLYTLRDKAHLTAA